MENWKRMRTSLRSLFTRNYNALQREFTVEKPNDEQIAILWDQLAEKGEDIKELDKKIMENMQSSDSTTQEDFDSEFETCEIYTNRLLEYRRKTLQFLERPRNTREESSARQVSINNDSTSTCPRKYKLPEIELKKFGGEPKDWLGFWGQFKKIDIDKEIVEEDKFQYLLQATVPKSKAREIVESFPPTKENYKKAIEHLKLRFGKEEMLVEVYIRSLLRLVMNNTMNKRTNINLSILYDQIETQLRALESLGVASEKYAAMLYPLVESCLSDDLIRTWERSKIHRIDTLSENEPNKLTLLMHFLREEVEADERITLSRTSFGFDSEQRKSFLRKKMTMDEHEIPTAAGLIACMAENPLKKKNQCIFCQKFHASADCRQARKLTMEEKINIARNSGSCFRCLKRNHTSKMCMGKQVCPRCNKRHLILMCPNKESSPSFNSHKKEECSSSEENKDLVLSNQNCTPSVLLQTLKVYLRGQHGTHKIRALIDSGSQKSYISDHAAALMNYKMLSQEEIIHNLFGGVQSAPQMHKKYRVYLTSLDGKFKCNFEALSQTQICGQVPEFQDTSLMKELKHLGVTLTDTSCNSKFAGKERDSEIHILIGADIAGKLFTGKLYELSCGLTAMETRLGWTVIGKMPLKEDSTYRTMNVLSMFIKDSDMSDLWRLDRLGINDPVETQTKKELQQATYEHFRKTLRVNEEGRYEISLPWIETHPTVVEGRQLAEKRLSSTIKKLHTTNMLKEYQDVLHSWLKDGMIEEIIEPEGSSPKHYLPHRAVIKEPSTTRIRPVFDASAHTKNTPSLNSCLEKGPNLIDVIPALLTRFRMRRIGVIADIRQAFLQISVKEEDRDFLRFFWYEDGDPQQLKIYRHCRVVFGLTTSPFLLSATIAHLIEQAVKKYPKTATLLQESFYVDNCVTSLDNYTELRQFILEAREIMGYGKFDLRGWIHSEGERSEISLTKGDPDNLDFENKEYSHTTTSNDVPILVLGISWDPIADVLYWEMKTPHCAEDSETTKRRILSVTQSIFDPLGILCPIILLPKLLLQECWKMMIPWDEHLPNEMSKKFTVWRNSLPQLQQIKIPRWIVDNNHTSENVSLHVFADASKSAYAACIFYHVQSRNTISCQLMRAKARVTPLKAITIPRLELLACTIAARLANSVREDIHSPDLRTFYWSDSTNAIHWIQKNEPWSTFVANRVKEIRQLSRPEDWYHVSGNKNPADLPSRGCSTTRLIELKWWEGPDWLKLPIEQWPTTECIANEEVVNKERRKTIVATVATTKETLWYCERFSSFLRITRLIAWMKRFIFNTRNSENKRINDKLTVDEIEEAEFTLLKLIQSESFSGINDTHIKALMPIVDERGLIRTQTRLIAREDTRNFRYPIILPSKHPAVLLLIMAKHREHSHAGTQILMSILREKYWILCGRKVIRLTLRRCICCRRFKATNVTSSSSPLPENRIREAAVFEVTGIDLGGPLYLRNKEKVWFVLFTCAVFRAIHIELVTSLSTEAFILALRRFIARRGRPKNIYSDNGTNFTGTNRALKHIDWDKVVEIFTIKRIRWNFIPPTAAWWGGWWERLIRMIKEILRKVLGKARVTYEEMITILCETEGIINNRPLTYLSDELEELSPLTPALFLREITDDRVPDLDILDSKNLNKRYRYRLKLRDDIKKRFRTEYLGQLKHVCKNKTLSPSIYKGQIVLIGSDNTKRLSWPLAKVLELYPGRDGKVRVVKVKTQTGEILRPIQRMYPLELEEVQGTSYREIVNSLPVFTSLRS